MSEVLDLSSNNPPPYDLAAVARSGVVGVVLKLTEGVDYVNPAFHPAWENAKAANLFRAAYHFARPVNDPHLEALHFLRNLPTLAPGDGVVLDLEDGAGDLSAWALAWVRAVETAVGFLPLCYSYLYFIQAHLSDSALAEYPLWLAAYGPVQPATPAPWKVTTLWQYTQSGACPGIDGNVDRSRTALDVAGLRALGKPSPAPVIPPTYRTAARVALKTAPNHASPIAIDPSRRAVILERGSEVVPVSSTTTAGDLWRGVTIPQTPIHGYILQKDIVEDAV
ncbi:MAG TPA: glycoside hydrolase family 25 protein [Chloroflexota bacterium]|nr:glycoside hydrolase family 25 protein [Chloroflexota bacterium]